MRVTNREKVLMAMYAEHVSENGDFEQVFPEAIEHFRKTLDRLEGGQEGDE